MGISSCILCSVFLLSFFRFLLFVLRWKLLPASVTASGQSQPRREFRFGFGRASASALRTRVRYGSFVNFVPCLKSGCACETGTNEWVWRAPPEWFVSLVLPRRRPFARVQHHYYFFIIYIFRFRERNTTTRNVLPRGEPTKRAISPLAGEPRNAIRPAGW